MATPEIDGLLPDAEGLLDVLRAVIDPEVGMNIVDLGLIYDIAVDAHVVHVVMTMTSPACPMGELIVDEAEEALSAVLPAGIAIDIELTWSPAWDPSMMSDAARRYFAS